MDTNLEAVLRWQHHQTTTPFTPRVGVASALAADPRTPDPPDKDEPEDNNGDEEENSEKEKEKEKQSGEKH